MDKLFRKVKTLDRIPTEYQRYETNIGNVHFLAFFRQNIEWWLEEVEIPSDKNNIKKRPVLEKAISILEESLELMSKLKSTDEDLLKNYRELIGETARLKEYIQKHNY